MKTWEMLKRLSENPEKTFRRISDGLEIRCICGRFNWVSGYTFLGTDDEWEEAREPVDFMTAFKAFREGKAISVEDGELSGARFTYYPRTNERYVAFLEEDIANGKWYIE